MAIILDSMNRVEKMNEIITLLESFIRTYIRGNEEIIS